MKIITNANMHKEAEAQVIVKNVTVTISQIYDGKKDCSPRLCVQVSEHLDQEESHGNTITNTLSIPIDGSYQLNEEEV